MQEDLRIAAECFEEFCRNNDVKPTNMKADYYIAGFYRGQRYEQEQVRPLAWISVDDKLPENGQIIVSYVERTITGGGENLVEHKMLVERFKDKFVCDKDQKHKMGGYEFHLVEKTTHWLPMPELPKKEA